MGSSFSLADDPWIPVIMTDGSPEELSLRDVFRKASDIRELTGDIPQQAIPMLRLLLSNMYAAYRDRSKDVLRDRDRLRLWKRIWDAGRFDIDVFDDYFDTWADRFFLLDDTHPFMQVPGLEYAGDREPDSVGAIIADMPKPDKFLFSMRSLAGAESLSLSEAARCLVFTQAYDTAGIKTPVVGNTHVNKGKVYAPKGAVGTGWLGAIGGVYVEGNNLFETLMLNWCLFDKRYDGDRFRLLGNDKDIPVWEQDEVPTPDLAVRAGFIGPATTLTWQSRRILLSPDETGDRIVGVVSGYVDIIAPYNTDGFEKMTAWRRSVPQKKKLGLPEPPTMPVLHMASKNLWRGLAPMLHVAPESSDDLRPGVVRWVERLRGEGCLDQGKHVMDMVSLHAQGMTYGTQSSVYETGIDDRLALHVSMFRHDYKGIGTVLDVVEHTDAAVGALAFFVHDLQVARGDRSPSDRVRASSEQVRENAYASLDMLFRNRIAAFTEDQDPERYGQEWKDEVHRHLMRVGKDYLSQSPVPVFDEHQGTRGIMNAAQAQMTFLAKLNKELGKLPERHVAASESEKGV